jgi:oxalate decarboxylase/phosphoglucose isomerase-like protein (cupin superfamily)
MSLTKSIEINSLNCLHPASGIEICLLDEPSPNVMEFQVPFSHETNLVQIAPGTVENLFVHHFQTDQLLVVKGRVVLVVLQNGSYQYILMSDRDPKVVKIPPGIPHGAINLSSDVCVAINSVIRHGPAHPRDYQPLKRPFPYDLEVVQGLLK